MDCCDSTDGAGHRETKMSFGRLRTKESFCHTTPASLRHQRFWIFLAGKVNDQDPTNDVAPRGVMEGEL